MRADTAGWDAFNNPGELGATGVLEGAEVVERGSYPALLDGFTEQKNRRQTENL